MACAFSIDFFASSAVIIRLMFIEWTMPEAHIAITKACISTSLSGAVKTI